jgi:hypothetical protein
MHRRIAVVRPGVLKVELRRRSEGLEHQAFPVSILRSNTTYAVMSTSSRVLRAEYCAGAFLEEARYRLLYRTEDSTRVAASRLFTSVAVTQAVLIATCPDTPWNFLRARDMRKSRSAQNIAPRRRYRGANAHVRE